MLAPGVSVKARRELRRRAGCGPWRGASEVPCAPRPSASGREIRGSVCAERQRADKCVSWETCLRKSFVLERSTAMTVKADARLSSARGTAAGERSIAVDNALEL